MFCGSAAFWCVSCKRNKLAKEAILNGVYSGQFWWKIPLAFGIVSVCRAWREKNHTLGVLMQIRLGEHLSDLGVVK